MIAEDDAISSLQASGLVDVLTWAASAAFAATDQLYDEDQGHDQGVVGYLNFKHFTDLLDRATTNGRFVLGADVEGTGDDVIKRGVTPEVFNSMPGLAANAVVRRDYKQSPGWAVEGFRVLLQSYPFGKINDIKWVQRSEAKRDVASQLYVRNDALFDDEEFGLESITGIPDDDDFVGVTLVVAHAFDPTTKQFEVYVGQSKNPDYPGDSCWHWKTLLLSGGAPLRGTGLSVPPAMPGDGATTEVEDVPVRIRKPRTDEGVGSANG